MKRSICILSLFPDYFRGPFNESILKRAQEKKLIEIQLVDLRDYSNDKWKRVDDRPFGGGPGMVLQAAPVVEAIRANKSENTHVVYLSPQGKKLTAQKARELANYDSLILLCGHYEGVDERALQLEVDEEISIGDYVLTSGQAAAVVTVDALARFVPGVLGDSEAAKQDSFENGILDCPHYTRPVEFEGIQVPEVLLGGNHSKISSWRHQMSLEKTKSARPDLYLRYCAAEKKERTTTRNVSMEVTLVVGDLKRSLKLYNKKMGFPVVCKSEGRAQLQVGETPLSLVEEQSFAREPGAMMRLMIHDREHFEEMVSKLMLEEELIEGFDITSGDDEALVSFNDFEGYRWMLLNSKGE